jgi:hypothetical protein|tara:strand:- start:10048 stop:10473 length:426 start_codon:yes stop_codon:yes gene_type:complete
MASIDTVRNALLDKINTSIASATPEQLAYLTKAANGIEQSTSWSTDAVDFTADSYGGHFVNTAAAAVTATLPPMGGNIAGDGRISFVDLAQKFQTNNFTISPATGNKILGQDSDILVNTQGIAVSIVWSGDTYGWQFLVQG